MLKRFQFILDVIFNQDRCSLCRRPGIYSSRRPWCQNCRQRMEDLSRAYPVCRHCGKYLCASAELCNDCISRPPEFGLARAVGPYEAEFRIAIKVYKSMGRRHLAGIMGRMMAAVVRQEPRFWPLDLVVPVPISQQGMCNRGFDQTELLSEKVAKLLNLPLEKGLLQRVKDTATQHDLSRSEREKNLLDAFQVKEPQKVYNKNVLLLDDVYTTGSTTRECTRILLDAGAIRVSVITWASGKGF